MTHVKELEKIRKSTKSDRISISYKPKKTFEESREELFEMLQNGIKELQNEIELLRGIGKDFNKDTWISKELREDIYKTQSKIFQTQGYLRIFFEKELAIQPVVSNPARAAMVEALGRVKALQ